MEFTTICSRIYTHRWPCCRQDIQNCGRQDHPWRPVRGALMYSWGGVCDLRRGHSLAGNPGAWSPILTRNRPTFQMFNSLVLSQHTLYIAHQCSQPRRPASCPSSISSTFVSQPLGLTVPCAWQSFYPISTGLSLPILLAQVNAPPSQTGPSHLEFPQVPPHSPA